MKAKDWKNVVPKTPASFEESLNKTLESIKTPANFAEDLNKVLDSIDERSNRRYRRRIISLVGILFLATIVILAIVIMLK